MIRLTVVGVSAAWLMFAGFANADGFYVSGAVGGDQREKYDSTNVQYQGPFGNVARDSSGAAQPYPYFNEVRYNTGWTVDGTVGYRFNLKQFGMVRTELDFGYGRYSVAGGDGRAFGTPYYPFQYNDTISVKSGDTYEVYNGTANAFYVFTQVPYLHPYIGAGVGYHYGHVDGGSLNYNQVVIIPGATDAQGHALPGPARYAFPYSETDSVQANTSHDGVYLAEVGLEAPITSHITLVPAFRYANTFQGSVPISTVKLGLRYDF